jgi:DNA repair exonuclease SbcCD ATPase subunit
MARPLGSTDPTRGTANGTPQVRPSMSGAGDRIDCPQTYEREQLLAENAQLRALCAELEQALQEATAGHEGGAGEAQLKEYELLLEEKSEVIRQLHQQVQELQTALAEAQASGAHAPTAGHRHQRGPAPREEELLALSEELERERRQLQQDEESLMEQMRQMEVSMARERAELARTRNDLQRLQSEIRHELERLERNGALQSKIDSLKTKFADVSARRGASPGASTAGTPPPPQSPTASGPPSRKDSILGRFFGPGKSS